MEEKSSNRTAVDLDSKMERRRLSPAKKKKRNHPGISFPDAEVIAISPRSLMATNRFICEICKKGFQREQNLQLHRRGHNLSWKLRQKSSSSSSSSSSKQVSKRRVYLCPEPTCVHHHPSRALGDLTGVKKHFSRKHGEKKWNCDKCDKRYAVQSDWKAHSKTCGTRDYSCDCGTLFSRRDSLITHRAFCNVFPQEAATVSRVPSYHLYGSNSGTGGSDNLMPTFPSSRFLFGGLNQDSFPSSLTQYRIPDLHISKNLQLDHDICNNQNDPFMFEQFSVGGNANLDPFNIGSFYNNDQSAFSFPHMSATALLQKPAEIGATTTTPPILNNNSNGNGNGNGNSSVLGNMTGSPIQYELPVGNEAHLQGLISSLVTENNAGMFGRDMQQHAAHHAGVLTRDFLGVEREPDPTNFTQQIPYGAANFQ